MAYVLTAFAEESSNLYSNEQYNALSELGNGFQTNTAASSMTMNSVLRTYGNVLMALVKYTAGDTAQTRYLGPESDLGSAFDIAVAKSLSAGHTIQNAGRYLLIRSNIDKSLHVKDVYTFKLKQAPSQTSHSYFKLTGCGDSLLIDITTTSVATHDVIIEIEIDASKYNGDYDPDAASSIVDVRNNALVKVNVWCSNGTSPVLMQSFTRSTNSGYVSLIPMSGGSTETTWDDVLDPISNPGHTTSYCFFRNTTMTSSDAEAAIEYDIP